ncbi:expressed protein [Phakopsora pachyrhizi]|uniref:Expressed protein n=1 Tax=Phakopsora pachyrhizi TaxID=170000 RepID=A0AAV0AIA6_PHAPC|nr:expressed protein [Phakopsora pachyrhizi]
MIVLRKYLILWLSPSLVLLPGKGVQGYFLMRSLGEEGEHLSLDSASRNSEDISNVRRNIHDDKRNNLVPTSCPLNMDYSDQMAKEHNNWEEEDISLIHEWDNPSSPPGSVFLFENPYEIQHGKSTSPRSANTNHKNLIDQPSNFQQAHNFYLEDPQKFVIIDEISFSGGTNQKETNPHLSSSKDQDLSSYTIQHMLDGDLHDGNHINSMSHSNEFRHPDPAFVSQINQNLEITRDEQVTENPALHIMQNDLHLSEMRNRVNENQDSEVLNPKPASSSHNPGFTNTEEYKDNENLTIGTSKKYEAINTKLEIESIDESAKERSDLVNILSNHFSILSKETAHISATKKQYGFMSAQQSTKTPEEEAIYKNFIDKKVLKFVKGNESKKGKKTKLGVERPFKKAETLAIGKRKRTKIVKYALGIQWNESESLKKTINQFAESFRKRRGLTVHDGLSRHIQTISFIGIAIMKIIAKNYAKNPVSENFGDDQSLINYSKRFWKYCFTNNREMGGGIRKFFKSIKECTSEEDIDKFLSTNFTKKDRNPGIIFAYIKDKLSTKTNWEQIYRFSWYFVFFRTIAYYPELFSKRGYIPGNYLKKFVEGGILYFLEKT